MKVYLTISGQTWDQIAYAVYGDEHYCDRIMNANRDKLDYFVFPAGVALQLPDKASLMAAAKVPSDYPTWRVVLNG
ncbi:MAG: tail protein X [Hungatella sp.]